MTCQRRLNSWTKRNGKLRDKMGSNHLGNAVLFAKFRARSVALGDACVSVARFKTGRAIVVFIGDVRITVAEKRAAEMRISASIDGGG